MEKYIFLNYNYEKHKKENIFSIKIGRIIENNVRLLSYINYS